MRAANLLGQPGATLVAVAAKVGRSTRTLERWNSEPQFRALVEEARERSAHERALNDALYSPNPEVRAVAAVEISVPERAGL